MYTNGIQFADSPIASGRGGVFTDGRNKNSRKVNYWVITNRLVFDLTKWMNITADYTYRRRDNLNSYRSYPTANTWDKNMKNIVEMTNGSIYDFYHEARAYLNGHVANAYLNVNKSWGNHNFTAVAGSQFQDYRSSTSTIRQKGSISDKLAFINMAQGTIERADESNTAYRTLGFFARVNYDYAGKYLFEISGREDGSSRFAKGDRWAFYPSASAGWRISEEKFWGGLKNWWDLAKVRVSIRFARKPAGQQLFLHQHHFHIDDELHVRQHEQGRNGQHSGSHHSRTDLGDGHHLQPRIRSRILQQQAQRERRLLHQGHKGYADLVTGTSGGVRNKLS